MKTITFTIFGHTFTFNFGGEPEEEIKKEETETRTFYNCCLEYIESQKCKLADSTRRGYRNICDNHLDYIMENFTIGEITEGHIQKAFDEEIAKGLSEKTLKGYRSFITKVITEYRPDLVLEIRVKPEEK